MVVLEDPTRVAVVWPPPATKDKETIFTEAKDGKPKSLSPVDPLTWSITLHDKCKGREYICL